MSLIDGRSFSSDDEERCKRACIQTRDAVECNFISLNIWDCGSKVMLHSNSIVC